MSSKLVYIISIRYADLYKIVSLDSVKLLKTMNVSNEELCHSSNEDKRLKISSKAAELIRSWVTEDQF